MEVLLGRRDAPVTEAFLDHLQVCAAGKQPGGMRVTQTVRSDVEAELGLLLGRLPHVAPKPVASDVPVRIHGSHMPRLIFAGRTSSGPVRGDGVAAVAAAAPP